jgi:hypothetical protein
MRNKRITDSTSYLQHSTDMGKYALKFPLDSIKDFALSLQRSFFITAKTESCTQNSQGLHVLLHSVITHTKQTREVLSADHLKFVSIFFFAVIAQSV